MRRPLRLPDCVIRPCQRPRLTTPATLTQRGTLGRVVYRYLTCALIASGIKGRWGSTGEVEGVRSLRRYSTV
jgi:hypothetical protein